ncbi:MAG: YkvA family protein [Anaerolineales bacterium]|nr:YkvA family protein [Anaerolineales bacterium]MCX7607613.1 YkvA family protein [Anaerolineales bacterium]MDW8226852.1 YkvA family protein [Anaerolineales bacterium]
MPSKTDLIVSPRDGVLQDIVRRLKLILRLMGDRRVNFFLKLLPIGALVYLFFPVDLAPGLTLPVIGALDDAAILLLSTSLFIALCPDEVVAEHLAALEKKTETPSAETNSEIIEGEARDVEQP